MESEQRQHEANARQCLADVQALRGLHDHADPDHRELVLNQLVERALHAYEGFRRLEARTRREWADAHSAFDPGLRAGLCRTATLHLEIGRDLVGQLDAAANDRLTVRNASAFRQAYSAMVSLEALDHGVLPPAIQDLATAAHGEHVASKTEEIDPHDNRNGVRSYRTWDLVKCTAGLEDSVKAMAEKRYRTFFAVDDRHPALGGRPYASGRRADAAPPLWSVEITFDYRAIAVLMEADAEPRSYVWFWIGSAEDFVRLTR